jgi:hypothetical protein
MEIDIMHISITLYSRDEESPNRGKQEISERDDGWLPIKILQKGEN